MADVKRCDICGEIYEVNAELNGHFTTFPVSQDSGFIFNRDDCCAVCTKKVKDFIDVLKRYGHKYEIHVKE